MTIQPIQKPKPRPGASARAPQPPRDRRITAHPPCGFCGEPIVWMLERPRLPTIHINYADGTYFLDSQGPQIAIPIWGYLFLHLVNKLWRWQQTYLCKLDNLAVYEKE